MNPRALLTSFVACGLALAPSLFAQSPSLQLPSPSPIATVKQRVGVTDIEIIYSRPSVKGRPIFGKMEPYGVVWRTGANASTDISFSTDVKLNGNPVPAGKYGLYTIPGENEWTVIIHKNPDLSGTSGYNETNDLVRFKVKPVRLNDLVETFAIDINDIRDDSATLNLSWEKTRVPVKIQTDVVTALVPKIEAAMAAEGRKPYYQAAMFYYDNNLDLQKAKTWIDAAVGEGETYFKLHLKAKILAKLGDKEGAIAAAKRSSELAIKSQGAQTGFVTLNDAIISSLQ